MFKNWKQKGIIYWDEFKGVLGMIAPCIIIFSTLYVEFF